MLTFIIPVRHPQNSKDWGALKARLSQTAKSIANQSSRDWQAIIVANTGADLPHLPENFSVEWVEFPPNPRHDRIEGEDIEVFRDFFRIDKGRRVRAGMLAARGATHFMICDDDDFVSDRLAGFVAEHPNDNGWYLDRGYAWTEGTTVLVGLPQFFMLCGTSHIVNAKLYDFDQLRASDSSEYLKRMLGSHIAVARTFAEAGTPLSALPFAGAIYRVGHAGAHSNSSSAMAMFLANKENLRRPRRLAKTIASTRLLTSGARREFFGA